MGTMRFEHIVEQQLRDRDDIAEIAVTLQEGEDLDVDPDFWPAMIPQLLLHSLSRAHNAHDQYSAAMAIALKELCKSSAVRARQETASLLCMMDELLNARMGKPPYKIEALNGGTLVQSSSASINLIVNAWGALVEMVHGSDPDTLQSVYPHIWSKLVPVTSLALVASPYTAVHLLKITATLYHKCIPNTLIHPCGTQTENYILVLLQSVKRIIASSSSDVPEYLFHDLAQTIKTWLVLFPPTALVDIVAMANALKSLATEVQTRSIADVEDIIFRIAILLSDNHASLPWFDNYLKEIQKTRSSSTWERGIEDRLTQCKITDDVMDAQQHAPKRLRLNLPEPMDTAESVEMDGSEELVQDLGLDKEDKIKRKWLRNLFSDILSQVRVASEDELSKKAEELFTIVDMLGIKALSSSQTKSLAEFAASCISRDISIVERIAGMYNLKLVNYLQYDMRHILPYTLGAIDGDAELQSIASMLDMSVRSLCEQGAHHLLVAFLLTDDGAFKEQGFDRMRKIFSSQHAPEDLLASRPTKVITLLAMELGVPGKTERAQQALQRVMQWLKFPESKSVGELLSQFFLGIADKIATFISEKRDPYKRVQHPSALASLNYIISIMGPAIESQAPQAIAIFQTVGELPDMQKNALMLWQTYTEQLSGDELLRRVNAITQGLLSIFPQCDPPTKRRIGQLLDDVISQCTAGKGIPEGLPDIPAFEELEHVRTMVDKKRFAMDLDDALQSIAARTQSDDVLDMLSAAQELLRVLETYGGMHPTMVKNRSLLYTALLSLAHKSFERSELQRLTSECLGILGACDPSQLDVKIAEENRPMLRNFRDKEENREFVCELLTKHLIPAFHAAGNEKIQQYIQYAIQEELREAGFTPDTLLGSAGSAAIRARWDKFSSAMQSLLTPLLHSSFQSKWDVRVPDYPIYLSAEDYGDWIKRWLYRLVETSDAATRPIFSHCFPVVHSGNLGLALTLLPHAVLHVLLSGSDADCTDIMQEIVGVLENHAEQSGPWNEQMQRASLQVVVMITGHCRKWLRHVQESMTTTSNTVTRRVREFLNSIPDGKMALASFRSKSYMQALMHLEQHIRTQRFGHGMLPADVIDFLRQLYALMDEKDNMAAAFLLKGRLRVDEEIAQFETNGEWELAKACYIQKLEQGTYDSDLVSGYFNCQRQSGDYFGMLGASTKLLQIHQDMFPRINAYRAEAAWKIGDWDMLDRATSLPMERSFDSFLSSAIANIRRGDNLAALSDITNARKEQMELLATTSMESFQHSHDHILRLQMLHELEQGHMAWETVRQQGTHEPIKVLQTTWKEQFHSLSPSYAVRRQLLELRQTALFGLRPAESISQMVSDDGSIWLKLSKTARKAGDLSTALKAVVYAESLGAPYAFMEHAKWYWENHEKKKAVNYLRSHQVNLDDKALMLLGKYSESVEDKKTTLRIYKKVIEVNPRWEKAHYAFGRFYDSCIPDVEYQKMHPKHVLICYHAVKAYLAALTWGSKYFYHTMPRVLSLWMLFADCVHSSSALKEKSTNTLDVYNKIINELRDKVPDIDANKFCLILPRLVSRLSHQESDTGEILMSIISKVFVTYPRTTIWALQPPQESSNENMRSRASIILSKANTMHKSESSLIPTIIQQAREFMVPFKELAFYDPGHESGVTRLSIGRFPTLAKMRNLELCIPSQDAMVPVLPETTETNNYNPYMDDLPRIDGFAQRIDVMLSLQRPKKFTMIGSDGKSYTFLSKTKDDLRKDARMMEFSYMINRFLRQDSSARQRELYIRTFGIIPLGEQWGLIEWIHNLAPLKQIVATEWAKEGREVRKIMQAARKKLDDATSLKEKMVAFETSILPECPPVFHRWFLQIFPDPAQWFLSRSRYIKTLAVMSIVGYILGLGDRHAENILFDSANGDCVHVDVNMLFDKGAHLAVPEIVPFRLTQNLIDGMGVLGYRGMFAATCEATLHVLRRNKIQLLSVFETLAHDPIAEWKKKTQIPAQEQAKQKMATISEKINNNMSVKQHVEALIISATDNSKLCQMFIGWAPFI